MGMFDDLVPKTTRPATTGMFDDLVPPQAPQTTGMFDDLVPQSMPAAVAGGPLPATAFMRGPTTEQQAAWDQAEQYRRAEAIWGPDYRPAWASSPVVAAPAQPQAVPVPVPAVPTAGGVFVPPAVSPETRSMWAPNPMQVATTNPVVPGHEGIDVGAGAVAKPPRGRSQFVKSLETGGENVLGGLAGSLATAIRVGQTVPGGWYPQTAATRAAQEQTAVKLDQWAQRLYEDAQRPEMQPKKGSGPWQYIQHVTGQTLPFMATAMAAGWGAGPAGAFMVGAAVEGDNAYRDAISSGADEQTAQTERIIVGTLNGAIEQMQIGGLLKLGKAGGPAAKTIVKAARDRAWKKLAAQTGKLASEHILNAVNEGLEESLQEAVGIGAATLHGDKIELADAARVGQAGLGGLTAGGILGGASTLLQQAQRQPEPDRPATAPAYQDVATEAVQPPAEIGTGGKGFTPTFQPEVPIIEEPSDVRAEVEPPIRREAAPAVAEEAPAPAAAQAPAQAAKEVTPGQIATGLQPIATEPKEVAKSVGQGGREAEIQSGQINTIAGKMDMTEFERMGYDPSEVTQSDWIALQRAERRRLGQAEGGDSRNAPWVEYEEYHKDATKRAVEHGDDVDDRVLEVYKGEPWADAALARMGESAPTEIGPESQSQGGQPQQAGPAQPEQEIVGRPSRPATPQERRYGALPGMAEEVREADRLALERALARFPAKEGVPAGYMPDVTDEMVARWQSGDEREFRRLDALRESLEQQMKPGTYIDDVDQGRLERERDRVVDEIDELLSGYYGWPKEAAGTAASAEESPIDKARRELTEIGSTVIRGKTFKVEDTGVGWVYVAPSGASGISVRQGGDPRGGGWGKDIAIDRLIRDEIEDRLGEPGPEVEATPRRPAKPAAPKARYSLEEGEALARRASEQSGVPISYQPSDGGFYRDDGAGRVRIEDFLRDEPVPVDKGTAPVVESGAEVEHEPATEQPRARVQRNQPGHPPAHEEASAEPLPVPAEPGRGGQLRETGAGAGEPVHGAGRRRRQGSQRDVRSDTGDVDQPARRRPAPRRPSDASGQLDYRITDADDIEAGGQKTKYRNNVAAIRLLKQIESEGRRATAEEQATLVKYTGWGGLPQAFDTWNAEWKQQAEELRELLTDDEYRAARASTPNAHYTSPGVVAGIWQGLKALGFRGGRVNEPAIGTGIFYGLMPDDIAAASRLFGVELDDVSARIAGQLYQSASIEHGGFQDARYPDGFFDLFISNVPFDEQTRPVDPDMRNVRFALHDFYFAKALKKTRPGGIVAFITSKGTMDKGNSTVRRYLAKQADLLGAVRLPKTAFGKIANTEVVTDIIVLQKRATGQAAQGQAWTELGQIEQGDETFNVNEYFVRHPEHILGKLSYAGSMYRANEMTVEPTDIDLNARVAELVGQFKTSQGIHADDAQRDQTMRKPEHLKMAPENVKERAYVMSGGKVFQKVDGLMVPVELAKALKPRFAAMIQVRDAARRLIGLQIDPDAEESAVEKARRELGKAYDLFVARYSPFHTPYNRNLFFEDPDSPLLLALEVWDNDAKKASKAPIFTERTQFPVKAIEKADSPEDAVGISMGERGRIDIDYIGSLLGIGTEKVGEEIAGHAYENPETGQWEPAFLYLSGNVRKKLAAAEAAAGLDAKYKTNVEALRSVQPQDIPPTDISVRLGSPWIDADTYLEFLRHLTGRGYNVKFTKFEHDGSWVVSGNATSGRWDTPDFSTSDLVIKTMNYKEATVWAKDADGNRYVDKEATTIARVMQQKIKDEFERWIWSDTDRAKRLSRVYNDTFNHTVFPQWDGSYLRCPGQSTTPLVGGKLRPHQANAVARFLTSGNMLMAHAVGAGKTFAGITMAMEGRRTGQVRKAVFVVPNHKIDDWRVDWMKLYPSANILAATRDDFTPRKRQTLMNRIATGDWDGVIVPMTSFERIPMSPDRIRAFFGEQIDELEMEIRALQAERGRENKNIVKRLEKAKSALQEKLKKQEASWKKDQGPYFDELGIDMMFVDESQAYKNLFFVTKMDRVSGLQVSQTQRSFDMYLKTQFLNETTRQRGIVYATGTPITNTIGEMFTLQRYLQPEAMRDAGLRAFDFWAKTFGDTVTDVEVDPTGAGFRMNTRFARFTNLPELMQMFRSVTDIVTKKQMNIPLPKVKRITIQVEPTADVKEYIQELVKRAEDIRAGHVKPWEDNMLAVTNDGRHVALDPRLRIKGASDSPDSKVNRCAEEVHRIYKEFAKDKALQVIWCDLSTPKKGQWSIYDDLKQKLIAKGVRKEEIAFIHDAADEKQQATLYQKANDGRIRVLLASTGKMGTGANVQKRLIATHHLTAPWVPAEVEQRDGRIERQGNMFEEVQKVDYVTKGTFDAYMWQTLETKAKFIEQVLNGETTAREVEDISKNSLTFAEVKALASGNPKILEAIKLDAQVKALQAEEKAHRADQFRIQEELEGTMPARIKAGERDVADLKADSEKAARAIADAGEDIDITVKGTRYTKRKEAGEALMAVLDAANKFEYSESERGESLAVGAAYGFRLEARFHAGGGSESPSVWRLRLVGRMVHMVDLGDNALGNVARIANAVAGIEDKYKQRLATLERDRRRMGELRELVGKPFPKADELTGKRDSLGRLQQEIGLGKKGDQPPTMIAEEQPQASDDSGEDPTIDVPSQQGGFLGGRPGGARASVSAIVQEGMSTGSAAADAMLRRTQGYGWTGKPGPLRQAARYAVRFARQFRFLDRIPKTEAFAGVREAFRQVVEVPKLAYSTAVERMQWALQPVAGTTLEARKRVQAVRMKLIADDLSEDVEKGVDLPPGLEESDVERMAERADALYDKYPSVQEAYERIRQVVKEHTDMLVEEGWLDPERARDMYFPHKVIKYLRNNDGFFGIGRRPSTPRKGYLRQRKGGVDYSTDVLERLVEHWAEVQRDIETTRFLRRIGQDEQAAFRKANPDWEKGDALPPEYQEMVVLPGRLYYRANGVSEDLAMALLSQNIDALETLLTEKGLAGKVPVRRMLAVGRKRAYIVRKPVAEQAMDMPTAPVSDHPLYKAVASGNTFIKRQILFNPFYAVPFHVTNFIGDAHKLLVSLPGALKSRHMADYFRQIVAAHRGNKGDLFADAQRMGVIGSGWLGADVKRVEAMIPVIERAEVSGGTAVAMNKAKRLFNAVRAVGQGREDWLRYAAFAHLVDLQDKGVDIMRFAIKDVAVARGLSGRQRAAKIARDICGDYTAIGKSGRMLSDTAMPFYRWMHLNLPWWPRMIAEYARRGNVGRITAALLAALGPYIAAMLWNYSDDERRRFEEKLPPWRRWNFHIVSKHGDKLYYIPLPLDDVVNFFGVPESLADFQAYQKGFIDLRQLAGRIAVNGAYQPGVSVINAVGGVLGVARDAAGIQTFPDIADYRITDPERRAMNALKTVFGAPAQLGEAVRRGQDERVHDLLWRSILPVRPWTMTTDPLDALMNATYERDQKARPQEPETWGPHKGRQVDVDRLRAQVSGSTPAEIEAARSRQVQAKADAQSRRLAEDLPRLATDELVSRIAANTYREHGTDHDMLDAHRGRESYVAALRAEYERRTGKAPDDAAIMDAQYELGEAARQKRLEKEYSR